MSGATNPSSMTAQAFAERAKGGERIEHIDTPAVVIDLDRAQRNVARFQAYCDEHGIVHRPHIKTHKLPYLAHLQVRAGAAGITVQTLGEAEVMAASGIRDLFLTFDLIGDTKARRLARLARFVDMRVAVDNEVALATVARGAALAERDVGVLIEFESGKQRQGVATPEQALRLARIAQDAPHLAFLGVMTYPSSPAVAPWLREARATFEEAGLPIQVASAGGTPGMWRAHELAGVTEYRAGSYVYHDRKTVAAGSGSLEDCALHVHATVVSRPTEERGVIDAGSKMLTSDPVPADVGTGHGLIVEYPDATISALSEEHGVVDFSACAHRPGIGERVRIVPNHVCPVSNLVDTVVAHREGWVEAHLDVAARGMH